jgi:5-formyltetrahydrofolate cyclo-ligase
MPDIRQRKRELRQMMQDRRAKALAENPQAAFALRDRALLELVLPPHAVVASYRAFGSEIDSTPLAEALRAMGHIIALPVVTGEGKALLFRRYEPGDRLAAGALGMSEPMPAAPAVEPDMLLVPLLAFDRRLHRLGYGGGYYDRTLKELRQRKDIVAMGLAFACQEIPEVPVGSHDIRLDKMATELQVFQS